MIWSIVERIRSKGQVVELHIKITCRISLVAVENCACKGKGKKQEKLAG